MPSLINHQSTEFVKLIILGNSKSGKTGSLTSLVRAGYHLGILDFDNLLDPLRTYILRECPDLIGNVHYITLRDAYSAGPDGPVIKGTPKAYVAATKMTAHWKTEDEDLGDPANWGPNWIFVVDSLSRLCDAAYNYFEPISGKDKRAAYRASQQSMGMYLANVTSEGFRTNVIVIGHLIYQTELDPSGAELTKAYPQGIGQKLSPRIPQYFPSVVHYYNKAGKRTIRTSSTPLLDLANPKPFEMSKEMPIETGLAEFFAIMREPPKEAQNATPSSNQERTQTLLRQQVRHSNREKTPQKAPPQAQVTQPNQPNLFRR